ncbi:MAG: cell division protein FtsK [Alphaproteobacteria bacterium]|nr:cell division protein FtsK [Alphaproteobacteria bacterium]
MSNKYNIKSSIFPLLVSVLLLIQYCLYNIYSKNVFLCTEYTPFIASSNTTNNIFIAIYFIISNISFQFLGIFSYVVVVCLFIRGILILFNISKYKKHKFVFTLIFFISGTMILNIISTYPTFQMFKIDYYAGGYIGYALSKIVFIDILKQNALYGWQVAILFAIWFWSIQYVCLFSYKINIKKLFSKCNKMFNNFNSKYKSSKQIVKNNKKQIVALHNNIKSDKQKQVSSYKPSNKNTLDINENNIEVNNEENIQDKNIINNIQVNETEKNEIDKVYQYSEADDINSNYNTGEYVLPSISLLDKVPVLSNDVDANKIQEDSNELLKVLEEFSVRGEIINAIRGPVVTMFEFKPAPGTKNSRVISLSDDIARSMQVATARISAIPGRNALGIELPNKQRQTVYLSELIGQKEFIDNNQGISLVLGKSINGNAILSDLTKMPHVLVAGTTGSGKSVSINCMILSILFKFKPEDCKLIMIDPKMLELSVYDDIPHLLTPVVIDPKKAVFALQWAVSEMENRYKQMSKLGVRNIESFNKKLIDAKEKPQLLVRRTQTGFNPNTGTPIFETQKFEFDPMPYIVVVIDEVADLMLVAGKEVEAAIQRLAQMARAAGIHLIMATQRPSVDIITGTIKANFPTRISFQVTSKIDSRTILGEQGAEQLLGKGDMLYMSGAGRIIRVHGPFVSDMEVDRVVDFIRNQSVPKYDDVITQQFNKINQINEVKPQTNKTEEINNNDDLYERALEIIRNDKKCSVTHLQRKLQIGYNRAARLIEEMENNGIVSAPNQNGKRIINI